EVKDDVSLVTDPVRLNTILSNFISNSLKYRKENEVCKIHLSAYKKDNRTIISVEDNGIGIEKVYLDKIFEMFFRANSNSEGSGLGLFIVKEAADKLNAEISVTSSVGKGSIFMLVFF
ncbi:MAG: ATP-binding protein, partial [Cyclobacteriaceae bacterium]|nr:ATP-binding protein [Cyclobacteriaceae bacterium]